MDTNLYAVVRLSQIFAKKMIENKIQGSIVNVSSHASQFGLNKHAAYTASKGALDSLTKVKNASNFPGYGFRIRLVWDSSEYGKSDSDMDCQGLVCLGR